MSSGYPENIIQKVLSELEALDVLEFVDYHTESIQRGGGVIRCYCPIHGEQVFRTLTVDEGRRAYRCSYAECDGSGGGDLIDLVARSRGWDYDAALKRLVDEYEIDILLGAETEDIDAMVEEAENFVELLSLKDKHRSMYREEAEKRLRRILNSKPHHPKALRVQIRLLEETGRSNETEEFSLRLIEAERQAGNTEQFLELAQEQLDRDPESVAVREMMARHYLAEGHDERAFEELMLLADAAEMAQEYERALEAYRHVETIAPEGVEVRPIITQLLITLGRPDEAVADLRAVAKKQIVDAELVAAAETLDAILAIQPQNDQVALDMIDLFIQRGLPHEDFTRAVELIDELMGREAFEEAVEGLQSLANVQSDSSALIERLITAHRQIGNHDMVADLQYKLINLYREADDFMSARFLLDEILESFPEDLKALRTYADIALEEEDSAEAIERLRTIANVYERAEELEQALELYREMQIIDEQDLGVREDLRVLLERTGHPDEALEVITGTCAILKERGNVPALVKNIEHAFEIEPDNPHLMMDHAEALDHLGKWGEAYIERIKACELLIERSEFGTAEKHLRFILELDDHRTRAIELLAETLNRQGRKDEARQLLGNLAAVLHDTEDYDKCREVLGNLLDENPNDLGALDLLRDCCEALEDEEGLIDARLRRMQFYKLRRDYDNAIKEGLVLLERRPANASARRELIELYTINEQHDRAREESWKLADLLHEGRDLQGEREVLEELIRRQSDDFEAIERLLHLLQEANEQRELQIRLDEYIESCREAEVVERAVETLRGLTEKDLMNAGLHHKLIGLFESIGQADEQVDQMRTLIAIHEQNGQEEEAITLLQKLVEIRSNDADSRRRLIEALRKNDRTEEALEELLTLGETHADAQRYDEAEEVYKEALELDAEHVGTYSGLVKLELAREQPMEAIAHLRQLAAVQARKGEFDDSLTTLYEALEIDENDTGVRRQIVDVCLHEDHQDVEMALDELDAMARAYKSKGNTDESLSARREAIELTPGDTKLRRILISELQEADRTQDAVAELMLLAERLRETEGAEESLGVLDEVVELDADHVEARTLRAQLFEESGDEKKALTEWRALAPLLKTAQSRGPSSPEVETTQLNVLPEYDFDRFVVSDRNRFAWATSIAVAKEPGHTPHNPLFLHSDVGLGKTHILHAVANYIFENHPKLKVIYTNSEDFTSELIDAIQNNTVIKFRQRHKSTDVLLLDDVQFLAGKERAQEEFFHIFNTLYQSKKQIIVTSDRPPKEIAHLEKRLKSRFGAGVIVDIQSPDRETRMAILRQLSKEHPDREIPEDALEVIAEHVDSNVREMKGAFHQLLLQNEIGEEPLNAETARNVVEKFSSSSTTE
ncbi:tetratricopeptide repeat protein [bacterium]|nr:tetratricopeptide repeat protein [bacterium]